MGKCDKHQKIHCPVCVHGDAEWPVVDAEASVSPLDGMVSWQHSQSVGQDLKDIRSNLFNTDVSEVCESTQKFLSDILDVLERIDADQNI